MDCAGGTSVVTGTVVWAGLCAAQLGFTEALVSGVNPAFLGPVQLEEVGAGAAPGPKLCPGPVVGVGVGAGLGAGAGAGSGPVGLKVGAARAPATVDLEGLVYEGPELAASVLAGWG